MNTVNLKNIQFSYPGASHQTLDIPEFKIKKGEKIFLYGPSGCGKTTLLETLAGVLVPQKGEVNINQTDIASLSSSVRDEFRAAHIGYIFQSFNLIPYLSVIENITLPLYLSSEKRNRVPRTIEMQESFKICEKLGIEKLIQKPVTELSVGQQQRVAAARAILGAPKLILADEPTSSLDFDHREKFIQLLFDSCIANEVSLLFVSHDRSLKDLFDRSISLPEINKAGSK